MKRDIRTISFLFFVLFIFIFSAGLFGGKDKITTLDVKFNINSLVKIVSNPEEILNDIDNFWANDKAFQLSKFWHTNNNIPIDMDKFRNDIRSMIESTPEERKANKYMKYAEAIKAREGEFMKKAIPHIMTFLPQNGLKMSTSVHLTAFTKAYCFMTHTQIVANVMSPKIYGTVDSILNLILHETYHIGYGINRHFRTEESLENRTKNFVLDVLHNEGMATYVAYKANGIYPNTGFEDYKLLEDMDEVKKRVQMVNEIFSNIEKLPKDEFRKISWDKGVLERGYYITGAHMARTIDEKKGRKALVDVIEKGPRAYVSLYNSIAKDNMKITEFPPPEKSSVYKRLFDYLNKEEVPNLLKFEEELRTEYNKDKKSVIGKLNRMAYKMIHYERADDAVFVLKLGLVLSPDNSNLYDSLGEAYMESGDNSSAVKSYKKSLMLNPKNIHAVKMLKKLSKK